MPDYVWLLSQLQKLSQEDLSIKETTDLVLEAKSNDADKVRILVQINKV